MRNDTGKIFLNASLYPGLKAQVRGGKAVVAMLANAAKEEKLPGAAADAGENELTLTCVDAATVPCTWRILLWVLSLRFAGLRRQDRLCWS